MSVEPTTITFPSTSCPVSASSTGLVTPWIVRLPVAVASMLSKYLREALMRRFNAFWQTHLPEVSPTAGYYGDGARFLQDIDSKRRELGIADAELVRSR